MNHRAVWAIYCFEIAKAWQVPLQSMAAPVITAALYFAVFGSALGHLQEVHGVGYGSFIVPGLTLLTVLTNAVSGASFSIFFQKYSGTIYEILAAPITPAEIIASHVAASTTKSIALALCIVPTAKIFVTFEIMHPLLSLIYLVITAATFSMLGFVIGAAAKGFERLEVIPMLIITPLTFLGGSFYSLGVLSPLWQRMSLINPLLYIINGMRWCFYGISDVPPIASLWVLLCAFSLSALCATWIFKPGRDISL